MAKAVFLNLPAHGHINPTLAVVGELVQRGEEVVYYSTEEFHQKIESTGAVFRDYKDSPKYDPAEEPGNTIKLAAALMEACEFIIPRILDDVRAENPDYIMHDSMCVWGKYIAQILDLPAVSSVPTFAFGRASGRASIGFTLDMFRQLLTNIPSLLKRRRIARRLERTYGTTNPGLLDAFANREALNIVYTSRYFQPVAENFDDSFKFVGHSINPRNDSTDFPFDELTGKTLIYISLGTVVNEQADFYHACFDAFGNRDQQVILSIGGRVDVSTLHDFPANFVVRNYVPQLEVLQRADLFITHGGMNSVHEGHYYGVPLIVVPQTGEQGLVAEQVARLGAGIYLKSGEISSRTLRETAGRVITDSTFQQNSQRIGDSLRSAGGYQRAVDEIFAFKAAHNIPV